MTGSLLAACAEDPPPRIPLARIQESGCVEWNGQPIERVCVPRTASDSVPLSFDIEASCGTCEARVDKCSVNTSGHDIFLSLDGRSCQRGAGVSDTACAAACGERRASCRIAPLAPGRYVVHWVDSAERSAVLEVATSTTSRTQCSF